MKNKRFKKNNNNNDAMDSTKVYHNLLEIVQDRLILFRIISDADKCSFEYDSVRCTSRDISFIHSPLAAFNSLLKNNTNAISLLCTRISIDLSLSSIALNEIN